MAVYIVINMLADIYGVGVSDLWIQYFCSSRSVFLWRISRGGGEVCAGSGRMHNLHYLSLLICEDHFLHFFCTARRSDRSIDNAIRGPVVCEQ